MQLSQRETNKLQETAEATIQFMGDWYCINRSLAGYTLTQYQECNWELVNQTDFPMFEEAAAELKRRVSAWLDDLVSQ